MSLLRRFFPITSKFKVNDTVVLAKGQSQQMMVVIEILSDHELRRPLIHCQWFESETKQTRRNIFREQDLAPFDWYEASEKSRAAANSK